MRQCEMVVFSDKAYNGIIRESFAKHPVETGGILLGYILDNGVWIVMEMVPPGLNCVHETALFEYDQDFVNYLGTSIANQYQKPLQVLGLWHRHPGAMDYFSSTDDVTNSDFASRNPYGVISGLINIDPNLRLTMYHLNHTDGPRPRNVAYSKVPFEVGDDLIPDRYFALRYVDAERRNLNPAAPSVSNSKAQKSGDDHSARSSEEVVPAENAGEASPLDIPKKKESPASKPWPKQKYAPILIAIICLLAGMSGGFAFGRITGQPAVSAKSDAGKANPPEEESTDNDANETTDGHQDRH